MPKKISDLRPGEEVELRLRPLAGFPVSQFTVEAQHIIEDAVLLNPAAVVKQLQQQGISAMAASRFLVGMSKRFPQYVEDEFDDEGALVTEAHVVPGNGAPLDYGDVVATRYLLQFTSFFLHALHEQDHLDSGAYLRAAAELEKLLSIEIPR